MGDNQIVMVLVLASFPAFGNLLGGLIGEWLMPSKAIVNRALHASAGIILGIVAIEIMPEAMKSAPAWILALMFVAGGCSYLLIDVVVEFLQNQFRSSFGTGAWKIYIAVAADLMGDGLLIGSGSAISSQLALILALGQVMADIPEGFSVIANFRDKGMERKQRILVSLSFFIPAIFSAVLAYYVLHDTSDFVKKTGLVFLAGLFSLAAVEDMLGEAHETVRDTKWSSICFLFGFALFLIVSNMLE